MRQLFRWWPVIGVLAMIALARVVGRGPTRLDRYFLRDNTTIYDWRLVLLFVTDHRVVTVAWVLGLAVALWQRRIRVALTVLATAPLSALLLVPAVKAAFGRTKGGSLAYPSGHTTALVVVAGLLVIVAAWQCWAVLAAAATIVAGMLGQSLTYHYFTDTVGALFLGTAVVSAAAVVAGTPPPGARARATLAGN